MVSKVRGVKQNKGPPQSQASLSFQQMKAQMQVRQPVPSSPVVPAAPFVHGCRPVGFLSPFPYHTQCIHRSQHLRLPRVCIIRSIHGTHNRHFQGMPAPQGQNQAQSFQQGYSPLDRLQQQQPYSQNPAAAFQQPPPQAPAQDFSQFGGQAFQQPQRPPPVPPGPQITPPAQQMENERKVNPRRRSLPPSSASLHSSLVPSSPGPKFRRPRLRACRAAMPSIPSTV